MMNLEDLQFIALEKKTHTVRSVYGCIPKIPYGYEVVAFRPINTEDPEEIFLSAIFLTGKGYVEKSKGSCAWVTPRLILKVPKEYTDTERLDWLNLHGKTHELYLGGPWRCMSAVEPERGYWKFAERHDLGIYETCREAIDAAMRQQEEQSKLAQGTPDTVAPKPRTRTRWMLIYRDGNFISPGASFYDSQAAADCASAKNRGKSSVISVEVPE